MADPHQDSGQSDTTGMRGISDNVIILNSDVKKIEAKDNVVEHHYVGGNIDSTSLAYVVPTSEHSSEVSPSPAPARIVTDPTTTTLADSSSTSDFGFRTVSLEEFKLHDGKASLIDIRSVTPSGNLQVNGPESIVNKSHHHSHSVLTESIATDSDMASDARVKSELSDEVESSSSNQFLSVSHQMPVQNILSYSGSNELTEPTATVSSAQNVSAIGTNNNENQTQNMLQLNQSNNTAQIADMKPQHQLHTIPQSQTVQIAAPRGIPMTPEVLQSVIQQVKAQQLSQQSSQPPQSSQDLSEDESGAQNNSVSFTLVSPSNPNSTAAPLGSSQNPIRIIQQGNRYTPMQQLSTEQLQQIMQVVQQQHTSATSKAQENGGTVIFNPHTNTKIMYRVIYPSELHKSQAASGQATYQVLKPVTLSQEQQTTTNIPHQKRQYRKRKDVVAQSSGSVANGEEEKERGVGDALELSKEEKEERKKHRPRTRSGRVSKPPKHMVKDYKHIHVLDWDEDYDDSDGGYSDLKQSDEEARARQNDEGEQETSPDLFQALGAGKPKNYKCQTCEKSYIGQAGLERHYRLAPEHRSSENGDLGNQIPSGMLADGEESSKDASITQDGNSRNSDPGLDSNKMNGLGENFSEDSNTQDSINSLGTSSPVIRRGRGRGSYRGRWAHLKHNAHARRKNKLREFTKMCSDEDLMEVLFPRLVGCISTWEFLLMKAEKGGSRPKVDIIYKEFEDLLRPLKKVCAGYMRPVAETDVLNSNSSDKVIQVHDPNLASCLGLHVGTYRVEEMLPDDSNSFSSLHNKLSAASISLSSNSTTQETNGTFTSDSVILGEKRKYEIASPLKADYIPNKKQSCLKTSMPSNYSSEQSFKPFSTLQSNGNGSSSLLKASSSLLPSHSLQPSISQSSTLVKEEPSSLSSSSSQSHPSVPYMLSASCGKDSIATSQALKSQLVPVVLDTGTGTNTVAVSSPQVLPVVFNPQSSRTTVASTASRTKTGQISSLPLLLAAPGNQLQGNTIFLTSGNQTASQNILVKTQPISQIAPQSTIQQNQNIVSSQLPTTSPISKSQISLLGTNKANLNGMPKVHCVSSSSSSIQKFDVNTKPTEVKVSRKLFQEATASSSLLPITTSSLSSSLSSSSLQSSSSFITNSSQPNNTIVVTSPHKVKASFNDNAKSVSSVLPPPPLSGAPVLDNANTYLQSVPQTCTSLNNGKRDLESEVLNFNHLEFSGREAEGSSIASVSSLSNVPVSDLNRVVATGNDEDLDSSFDISAGVLSSIGFSGDELSSLNTSSDNPPSIPVSLPSMGVNSVINEIISPPSNGVSLIQSTKTITETDSINGVNTTDSPFINGSSSEFPSISPPPLKMKNNIILPGTQSSSSFISSSSDFIHLISNRPSSPLMSSPGKDSSLNNSITSVSFNLPSVDNALQSQILKSDSTPSTIMDLGTLAFTDQNVEQQLNGVASTLHSSEVDNILPEQINQSDEAVNPLLELPQQLVSDDMTVVSNSAGEEEGQLLLTEGSNIYQTDDGAWFIQSADGNTYQLQGAQGLPLETVQALLSGNLDLNSEPQTDDSVHSTHVMH